MIKVRLTFADNDKGNKELQKVISNLEKSFDILSQSDVYKGRGKNSYSNVYIDLEVENG